MILDLRCGHLGDVLLAAPAMRPGDAVIVSDVRYRVPGLPVEWLSSGRGVSPTLRPAEHVTRSWLDVTGRSPVRHQLMPSSPKSGVVIAPSVEGDGKSWSRWGELLQRIPGAVVVTDALPRVPWMSVLALAEWVICPDTGTAHMADALGARVIALHGLGRAHFEQYAPYWDRSHCIVRDAMDDITPDDVIEVMHG